MNRRKLLRKILQRQTSIRFHEMEVILEAFGFQLCRITGSHHIYHHPSVHELINVQEVDGEVKPYQVRQFLKLIEWYNLDMEEQE
jgi:predicted RNA binding protein YcfA (HicA-like mRNA interferase family)